MSRRFNTTGPCVPRDHYMLSPGNRAGRILALIEQKKYFVLRAGRQVGKTTTAQWLVQKMTHEGKYAAVFLDVQMARERAEPAEAFRTILIQLEYAVRHQFPGTPPFDRAQLLSDPESAIFRALRQLSQQCDRPIVLLIDEADGLVGKSMVSLLSQLRAGYIDREAEPFPQSILLIGQQEIRDYALAPDERAALAWLGTASPFNITAETVTLGSFSRMEVVELLGQHTEETGQKFAPEAVEHLWYLSQGHPWLVNALAADAIEREVPSPSEYITAAHVEAAKERIILERRTHIDSLVAKLREDRVKRVISPMLSGGAIDGDALDDDFAYVAGLGLIRLIDGRWQPSNPIYREVIVRALTYIRQTQILHDTAWYVNPDGSLDLEKLFTAFQEFWRIDGHLAVEGFNYREAGPHLTLMAFLQRVVNGGGQIHREYALGRGALDILVEWQSTRHAIEVKLRRDTETETDAYKQVLRYLAQLNLDEGWLVLFDLRSTAPWSERLFIKTVEVGGKRVRVVGA